MRADRYITGTVCSLHEASSRSKNTIFLIIKLMKMIQVEHYKLVSEAGPVNIYLQGVVWLSPEKHTCLYNCRQTSRLWQFGFNIWEKFRFVQNFFPLSSSPFGKLPTLKGILYIYFFLFYAKTFSHTSWFITKVSNKIFGFILREK